MYRARLKFLIPVLFFGSRLVLVSVLTHAATRQGRLTCAVLDKDAPWRNYIIFIFCWEARGWPKIPVPVFRPNSKYFLWRVFSCKLFGLTTRVEQD